MNTFLNHMLSKGAILGLVMLISHIAEQSALIYGATTTWTTIMGIEMVIAFVVYIILLRRFTKSYASLVLAERKDLPHFSYLNGLSYAISISALAGVIVGLGGFMFRHFIIGHEAYIAGYTALLQNALAGSQIPASMASTYEQIFEQIKNAPEPTLFSMILGSIWNYMLSGLIIGLFVAASTKRNPQIFDTNNEE